MKIMKITNLTAKALTLSFVTSSLLVGASIPSSSDIQREVQPPKDLPKKVTPLVEVGGVQKYAPVMQDDKSGKTIFVKSFKITGAIHMSESKLQSLIGSYMDKELTFAQLQEVASIITKEYRANGYFVARAYIPIQSMQDGVVEIAIIEGNYGKFILENNSHVRTPIVQAMLDDVKSANIVSTNTLERAMLIINDTPGAKVTAADVKPRQEVGTSDFAITTETKPWYDGYVLGDNYGSRYTGENRLMVGVNLNSLAGLGDKLSLSGLMSSERDLKNGRIAYSVPLMANGLRAEVGYSKTDYSLAQEYKSLDAYGTSNTLDATLSYPIIRTRLETLRVSSTLAIKSLNDKQAGVTTSDKDAKSINLALSYTKEQKLFGLDSQINSGVSYTYGNLKFIDAASKIADAAGANTQGNYSKVNGYVGISTLLPQELTLQTNLQAQKALGGKNLDGSEDMSIGGSNGVKLFPDSEHSAENALLWSIELTRALPTINSYSHKFGLFYDVGYASMQDDSKDPTFQNRTLQDVGVSYYASYKSLFAKAQVATAIGSEEVTSEPKYSTRVLVQGGVSF
ncbi:Hemolysin activation/secretion protein-like protein [Sulfurimonas denitrificans DSM 1251]|uniref:Hemolysin activation/secretion protein-like protein n=1 Tax=Sulfurimonas denitrificans (strain ATCC 33889 / DSM 1251) TaxID=326298 RepID=Q30RU6_SULDN|nr:ShlB/FhaC/HecB family hemolysin secretion/activation protein [Sulfurimonas denitrificans]ABB44285.1 Hemolysin activation/secretion protein-like protein [Sulfurimonas denitrificans DSM 1251]